MASSCPIYDGCWIVIIKQAGEALYGWLWLSVQHSSLESNRKQTQTENHEVFNCSWLKSWQNMNWYTIILCQIESLSSLNHLTFIALGYKGSLLIFWTPFSHVNNFSSRLALPFVPHWYNLVHWLHELFWKMTMVS